MNDGSFFDSQLLTKDDHSIVCEQKLTIIFFILCRQRQNIPCCARYVVKDLLLNLKHTYDEQKQISPYLHMFIQMILYTRDFYLGKGDRFVTYFLVSELYSVFPGAGLCVFKSLIYDNSITGQPSYGSWKDCQYMCEFLKDNTTEGENHLMIEQIIKLMNEQLETDTNSWKHNHIMERQFLTNVAKWIPREHKKCHWIFEKLVVQYVRTHKPQWLSCAKTTYSYERAMNKSRKYYRKKVSLLNKALNTFQIHQCGHNMDNIDFNSISKTTLSKQKQWNYYTYGTKQLNICDYKIHNHWYNKLNTTSVSNNKYHGLYHSYEPAYFIREAVYIISLPVHQREYHTYRIQQLWNKQRHFIKGLQIQRVFPIVDISQTMYTDNKEHLYQALGMSIGLSWYAGEQYTKRIICIGVNPMWIDFSHCETIVDAVEFIINTIEYNCNTICDYHKLFTFLFNTAIQIQSMIDKSDTTWVLFGRLTNSFTDMICRFNNFASYILLNKRPNFCYWNVSTDDSVDIQDINVENVLLLSGVGFPLLNALNSPSMKTFNSVRNCIAQNRYTSWNNGTTLV